jgi:DNA-directed RNA polymerase subunit M/transcription elongation factor TFIIS
MCCCTCPRCGAMLYFDEDSWDMSVICPHCNPYPPRESSVPISEIATNLVIQHLKESREELR